MKPHATETILPLTGSSPLAFSSGKFWFPGFPERTSDASQNPAHSRNA